MTPVRDDELPDDEEEDEDYVPGDTDYDLSEAHGYVEDAEPIWQPRPWLIATITLLVIAALVLPAVFTILVLR